MNESCLSLASARNAGVQWLEIRRDLIFLGQEGLFLSFHPLGLFVLGEQEPRFLIYFSSKGQTAMDKQEVVITRSKDINGQLFQVLDKKTLKPTEWQPSSNASIVQIAEAIHGTFDVKGFLSHNFKFLLLSV